MDTIAVNRERADQLRDLGRWHEAVAAYREVLAAEPTDDDARVGLAGALTGSNDDDGALRELGTVLGRAPGRSDARYQRAVIHAAARRDTEATADLDRLLADGFTEWYVWSDRGGLALRNGRIAAALDDLEEAERRAPGEPSVLHNLGVALLHAGRPAEAFERLAVAAEAGTPGSAGLRERARSSLADVMQGSDVQAMVDAVSAAASRDDVVRLARRWPAVLAPRGLDAVEAEFRTRPPAERAASASRLDDLRRLAATVRGAEPARHDERERPLPSAEGGELERYEQAVARLALLHDNGRRAEAADLAVDIAVAAQQLYGPRSATFGRRMLDLSTAAAAAGRRQVADPALMTAIDILMDADPAALPDGLVNYANLLDGTDRDDEAAGPLDVLQLAAKIVRELPHAIGHATAARVHRAHAAALRRAGRADHAERLLREAVDTPSLTGAGAEDSRATVLTALAEVLFAQGRPREAIPLCERVIALARDVHGEIHRDVALATRGLGRVHLAAGDTDAALAALSRSLTVWERLGRSVAAEVALTTADLTTAYAQAGAATQARAAVERTLAVVDGIPDDKHVPYVLDTVAGALRQLADAEAELTVRLRLVELGGRTAAGPEAGQLNALADVYFRLRRYADAEQWYSAALDAVLREPAPDPATVAILHHNLANVLGDTGRYAEALVRHEQALAALSVVRPPGHPDLLQVIIDTVTTAVDVGQVERARELLEQARPHLDATPHLLRRAARLADQLDAPPMDGTDVGELAGAAAAAARDGDDDRATELFDRALTLVVDEYGPDHPAAAALKHNFAVARSAAGRTAGTVDLFRDALRIREAALDPDDERLANTRLDLAQELYAQGVETEAGELAAAVLASRDIENRPVMAGRAHTLVGTLAQRRGRLAEAGRHLDTAVRLADATGDPANRIAARRNLVALRLDQRRHADAADLAEQAVALGVELVGARDRLTVEARLSLAKVERTRGRFVDSEPMLRVVVEELERLGVPDSDFTVTDACMELALSLHGLGRLHEADAWSRRASAGATGRPHAPGILINRARMFLDAGHLDRARALAREAVDELAARLGTDHPRYGRALGVLGEIEVHGRHRVIGISHLVEAHDILAAAHGPDHPSLVEPLTVLAQEYQGVGARDTARSFARRAVDLARDAYGAGHPGLAPPLLVLARSAALDGDVDEALRLALSATRLTPKLPTNLSFLARLHAARGEPDAALGVLRRIIALEDEQLPTVLATASEAHRRAYLERVWTTVDDVLTIALAGERDTLASEAWHLVVRRRGINAEHLRRERRAASAQARPRLARTLRELAAIRAELARAAYDDTAAVAQLDARREELEQLLAEQVDTPAASGLAFTPAIPDGTVYVEYVRSSVVDVDNLVLGRPHTGNDPLSRRPRHRYLAFVVTTRAEPGELLDVRMVDLGDADQLDALISAGRSRLVAAEPFDDGIALRERLLDPLLAPDDGTPLLVVPDGAIGTLPLQVLPAGDGRFLADHRSITYLDSARDLVDRPDTTRYRGQGPPLVVADPDYDLGASPGSDAGYPARRLAGTRREGEAVAALLGVRPHLDARAVRTAVEQVASPRLLHLATHGLFLADPEPPPVSDVFDSIELLTVPGEGAFVLGATPLTGPATAMPGLPGTDSDPLLRSAVVLAGFNTWVGGGEPPLEAGNGLLTADEVCALDLQRTTLVVLSACETGLGGSRPTEGAVGLRWAFGVAGARTVVTSLWAVPDRATRDLMVGLYRRLLEGATVGQALREAQRALAERYPHPFWWGAFVCHGDPDARLRPRPSEGRDTHRAP